MSSVSVKDRLFAHKNQLDWWFDKLLLLAICTVAWSLIAIRSPTREAINVFHIVGCLLLRVFSESGIGGRGTLPISGVALSVIPKLTILTARILLNILVDLLPIGAIIGFGVMRSTRHPAFSKMGLWPYLLFGLIFATVNVNFVYGLVLGGVIDWRSRFLIMLMLTAFYFSLPWGSISKWFRARTGLYFDDAVRTAMAAAIIKLVYTVVLTFIIYPLNLVGWVDYRARILAKDASVLEELTDFGSCDSKYCFTEYRSGGTHALAIEYWADGTAAYVVPWLRIAALRID